MQTTSLGMQIMKILIFTLMLTVLVFGQSNISIGGDNSFNNNNGNIHIQQSNIITQTERDIDANIANNLQKTNFLLTLLHEAKKINRIKTTSKDKERRCKNKVNALITIFGHKVKFGYDKCEELFH